MWKSALTRKFKPIFGSCLTVIDIETTGLDINKNGVMSMSLVTVHSDSWNKDVFSFEGKDISYSILYADPEELGRVSNPHTMEFHNNLPEHIQRLNKPVEGEKPFCWDQITDLITLYMQSVDNFAEANDLPHYFMGNGPDFDQAFLAGYFKQLNKPLPWKHWQNVDFRTLAAIYPIPEDVWGRLKGKASELLADQHSIDKTLDYSHFAGFDTILETLGAVWILQQLRK